MGLIGRYAEQVYGVIRDLAKINGISAEELKEMRGVATLSYAQATRIAMESGWLDEIEKRMPAVGGYVRSDAPERLDLHDQGFTACLYRAWR
jgi:hypothetical protein